jgi:hypothetical protein
MANDVTELLDALTDDQYPTLLEAIVEAQAQATGQ